MMPDDFATLDCHAVVRRLWDYLDGALGEADVRAIDAHLARCELCPPHFAFERAFLAAVRSARSTSADTSAIRARVLTALTRDGLLANE
jgi:anti-sigma factor (TIGR02949 family)